jgi:hypothetical protein
LDRRGYPSGILDGLRYTPRREPSGDPSRDLIVHSRGMAWMDKKKVESWLIDRGVETEEVERFFREGGEKW